MSWIPVSKINPPLDTWVRVRHPDMRKGYGMIHSEHKIWLCTKSCTTPIEWRPIIKRLAEIISENHKV